MSEAFTALVSQTRDWFERAHADGWLTQNDLQRFASIEQRTPADLFAAAPRRPLVVAFFGGTGVGKSSLLNRLAGETIARTGVERPTSREVTIYVHAGVQLAALPSELPVEQVQVRRHSMDDRRDVLWIDAPDIDSAHERNRALALAWLPHVDLLVYVVSPERYRDDVGWRVLQQRGAKHGWIFVLNRWDEGDASQADDFAQMLRAAGFNDPLLVCTCCLETAPPLPTADGFDHIEEMIRSLLAEHGVRELERVGQRARLLELRDALHAARQRCGDDGRWRQVRAGWQRHWQRARDALAQGLEWPIRAAAARFAIRERGLLGQVARQAADWARTGSGGEASAAGATRAQAVGDADDAATLGDLPLAQMLWDEWTEDKLSGCLDAVEVEMRRLGLSAAPPRAQLDATAEQAGEVVLRSVQDRLRTALARPGTRLQRALRRVTGFLMAALPLLALLWVAYNVVAGYYHASRGAAAYFGTDFAVSSALLILVAWAVPFVCDRLLRPSLERTALAAMRQGLAAGLDRLDGRLRESLAQAAQQAQTCRDEANGIFNEISRVALMPVRADQKSLARLLVSPQQAAAAPDRSASGESIGF